MIDSRIVPRIKRSDTLTVFAATTLGSRTGDCTLEVSTGGGDSPVWRRDGKELFFQIYADGAPQKTMAVSVTPNGPSLRLGKPVPMFDMRMTGPAGDAVQYLTGNNPGAGYDVLPDGRLVMVRIAAPTDIREIVVVQNWFEDLKRRVPAK